MEKRLARPERLEPARGWHAPATAAGRRAKVNEGWGTADRRRAAGFEAIELLRGRGVTQEYPRHWHDEMYVCAALSGTSYLDCRGSSLLMRRGTLAVVAPGDVHANRKIGCSFRCVLMDFGVMRSGLEQFAQQNPGAMNFRSGLIEDPQLYDTFLRFHGSLENDSDLGRDECVALFLHRLAVKHSTAAFSEVRDGNEDYAVRRTRQFLQEHYAERVSLLELARLTRLSAYHLNRSFCRKIGMPPHEYQVQVRILKAKSFLRRGRSIAETAALVGFVDQSHFTRHFKRSVGVTPGKFLQ
jgi:AraC-like DNA-binding protein